MFIRTNISATNKDEAYTISKTLVRNKLVAGTIIYKGICHYWWKKEIVEREYHTVQAVTLDKYKKKIVETVKKIHSDECPIIEFHEIDGNIEYLDWIKDSLK